MLIQEMRNNNNKEKNDDIVFKIANQLMMLVSKMSVDSSSSIFDERRALLNLLSSTRRATKNKSHLNTPIFHAPGNLTGTPLMIACWRLNLHAARLLIDSGSDVNVRDASGSSVLMHVLRMPEFVHAAQPLNQQRRKSLVKLLIERGADVNTGDHRYTALAVAARGRTKEDTEIVEMLLKSGADVNMPCLAHSRTPLMLCGSVETARVLLEHGARVDAQDELDQTALFYHLDNLAIMKLLFEYGSNVYHRDSNGTSAIERCDPFACTNETAYLAKMNLKSIAEYFKRTSTESIRRMVQSYVTSPLVREDEFPIRACHLVALERLNSLLDIDQQSKCKTTSTTTVGSSVNTPRISREEIFEDLEFVAYFGSEDFQEKLWADVILKLDENEIVVDGQTLRGKKLRAMRSRDNQLGEVLELVKLINEKQSSLKRFDQLVVSLIKSVDRCRMMMVPPRQQQPIQSNNRLSTSF